MSRIVVKNIPPYVTQDRLKSHFSLQGLEITDCKLVTRDGKSRGFSFIGFKTESQAEKAIQYYNNTFIDTLRITVELAKTIGEDTRPWSKYSKGSSAYKQLNADKQETTEKATPQDKTVKKTETPDLQEFLDVMKKESKTWGNDFEIPKDDEEYQDLTKPIEAPVVEIVEPPVAQQTKAAALDSTISDMDYLKSKMVQKEQPETMKVNPGRLAILQESGAVEEVINNINQENTPVVVEHTQDQVETPSPDLIADTGRIMVRNLPYSCTHEDLEKKFGEYGNLVEVHLPIEKLTKQSKGYAFVMYMIPEDAVKAYTELDGSIFQGRIIEIVAAKEKPSEKPMVNAATGFKSKKEGEQKSKAGNDFNWNSLFMNSNAVADAIARKLGVQKNQVFDSRSDDMAVKLALAETDIINETREYFEEQGVDLKSTGKRSVNVILVKNIPSSTTEQNLIELFSAFGELGRVVLPPARTLALVEFPDRNEAKIAFRKLAYTKFKNLPLFLEWAPEGTFVEGFDKEKVDQIKKERAALLVKKIQDNGEESTPTATVFVKNLNFETTEARIKDAFEHIGGLRSARISTKLYKGQRQSMGFGFLEFTTTEDAMRCIKTMQVFSN